MSREFTEKMFQCIKGIEFKIDGYTYIIKGFSEDYDVFKIRFESSYYPGNFREYGVNMFMFILQNSSITGIEENQKLLQKLQEEFPERFI